ncbi:tail protein X [Burkholderia vietnamiensis]|uniref:tail protein X n=1 Tax=Burkholderia vietnamiensis TaxID=60552 RepID=UPI001BA0FB4E|nr:tail protein X [Burkholderia vietnamiensis]MBR8055673.1 tail protein X [Burkholderia vietnamiensis]
MRVYAQQGDTVDALCYRHLGRTQSVVEATLEMNAGLADYGPVLPLGLAVDLPDPPNDQPTVTLVNLFD